VSLLIEEGANPYVKEFQGANSFEEASGNEEILTILRLTKCKESDIIMNNEMS